MVTAARIQATHAAKFGCVRMHGFTYVGLLFGMVLLGILLSTVGVMWETQARREKEQQLIFVGTQYQQAIAAYRATQVNGQNQLPPSIDELIEDRRFPMPVRHLRKRYVDPITNSREWGLVREGNGIVAVYSLSPERPIKQAGFSACCESFAGAEHYSDWKFGAAQVAVQKTTHQVAEQQ